MVHKNDHKSNCEFWYKKIERNIQRDNEVNDYLIKNGWKVFRFWESELKSQPDKCLNEIFKLYEQYKKRKLYIDERTIWKFEISITDVWPSFSE